MRPIVPSLILAAMAWVGALVGCVEESGSPAPTGTHPVDPPPPNPDTVKPDTIDPDTITRTWILPFARGTPDSELVGDFAPVGEGNTWIYHQSRTRSLTYNPLARQTDVDTEWVAEVEVRILSVEPSDTGRLIRVRIDEKPLAVRCWERVSGKTWRWEEPPRDSARSEDILYLEKGDAFFQLGPDGKWKRAAAGFGLLYHRFEKFYTYLDPESPWRDTVAYAPGSGGVTYLKDVGMVRMDYRESTSYGSKETRVTLTSFNDRILLDSLHEDLRRPLAPKDPRTGIVTLEDVKASLPAGYCAEPGPPKTADPEQALYDWVDIVPGKNWEYLASEINSFSAAWYASGTTSYQGLSRMTVTGTLVSGTCTFFGWRETDSLFQGESTTWDGIKHTRSPLPAMLVSASGFGVKRGQGIYRWSMEGHAGTLDSLDAGLDHQGVVWPFVSGQAGIAPGAMDSSYASVRRLSYADWGAKRHLVYSYLRLPIAPISGMEYTFVKGVGIVYSRFHNDRILPYNTTTRTLELFRLDGMVLDDAVFSRYQALKPSQP